MLNQRSCAEVRRQHRLGQMRTTAIVVGVICALIITVLASLVGVAIVLPAIQQSRESARREQARNNLKQIGLALQNYHEVQSHLDGEVNECEPELDDK